MLNQVTYDQAITNTRRALIETGCDNARIQNIAKTICNIFLIDDLLKVVKVDPKYTSQTCNVCGHVEQANRVKSKFSCKACGHSDHADLNAAKNIRDKFLAASTKPAKQVAVKQPNVLDL